jgi:hypothetical protein
LSTAAVLVASFAAYFAATYLLTGVRTKLRARQNAADNDAAASGPSTNAKQARAERNESGIVSRAGHTAGTENTGVRQGIEGK